MGVIYAFITIACYAAYDFFIKKTAGKINDYIGVIGILLVATVPSILMLTVFKFPEKKLMITSSGLTYVALAGVALGIGTISFLKLFDTGINLSIASPFVRIGIMITTTTLGLLLLREVVEPKEWIGIALALIGMLIVVWK